MSSSPDPVANMRDAWRLARQALFFTSVRGRQETRTHDLHIDGYSTVSALYRHGNGVESKPFCAGGHQWKLTYYPNGCPDSKTGSPGVDLRLMHTSFFGNEAKAMAGYTVSVLDHDGNLLWSRCVQPQQLRPWRSTGIGLTDATAEETQVALRQLKDDSLVIRCDLTVHTSEKESRLRWLLRWILD